MTILAEICKEITDGTISYSEHYLDRILSEPTPARADLRFMLCDDDPDVIEYNDDDRCLIFGFSTDGRVGHAVCVHPPEAKVVTAYWPDTQPWKWSADFRSRVRKPK